MLYEMAGERTGLKNALDYLVICLILLELSSNFSAVLFFFICWTTPLNQIDYFGSHFI